MALPKFVALKSNDNNKYLRYINEDVQVHGFLQSTGMEVASPYTKYEVEPAKTVKGLVHIRCCYNNKYWVRMSHNHSWILARADEPNEDRFHWSCTLFEPVNVQTPGHGDAAANAKTVLRLRHVQLNHYACLRNIVASHDSLVTPSPSLEYESCLFTGSPNGNDITDVFTIIDLHSLFMLPKHVVFKGDNGNYLGIRMIDNHPYLKFSFRDIQDEQVQNEVVTTGNGSVRIKSVSSGKFWKRNANRIWVDSDDTTNCNEMLFWPNKVDDNVVSLRNLGNNNLCQRLTDEPRTDCLIAAVPTISKKAQLEVVEAVTSRKIDNVKFRPLDGRIYNLVFRTMAIKYFINPTSEAVTETIELPYRDVKKSKWDSSVSVKLVNEITIKSRVPTIEDGIIKIQNDEEIQKIKWGHTVTQITDKIITHTVTVQPKTMVVISLQATTSSYDIPFSYSQHDNPINNKRPNPYYMDDGIYTGTNFFNFHVETTVENF